MPTSPCRPRPLASRAGLRSSGHPRVPLPGGLVHQEPARYGSLHHPGDQYSFDIFDQVGLGLRSSGSRALGPLRPRHIVAVGESQSAFYLTTFADTLEPLSRAFDGIFIHSRAGYAAPLNGASFSSGVGMSKVRIRTDLTVPVFMFETQTDLILLGYAAAQQPDTRMIRTWEVAGTSHADSFILGPVPLSLLGCSGEVNTGPQHLVVQAAFTDFVRWVAHGTPPPLPPPFRLRKASPPALALDRYGNVIGGVRTPGRSAGLDAERGARLGRERDLRALRFHRLVQPPEACRALRDSPALPGAVHRGARSLHCRRLRPPGRPGRTPRPSSTAQLPAVIRRTPSSGILDHPVRLPLSRPISTGVRTHGVGCPRKWSTCRFRRPKGRMLRLRARTARRSVPPSRSAALEAPEVLLVIWTSHKRSLAHGCTFVTERQLEGGKWEPPSA